MGQQVVTHHVALLNLRNRITAILNGTVVSQVLVVFLSSAACYLGIKKGQCHA